MVMHIKRRMETEREKKEKEIFQKLSVRQDVEKEWRAFRKKRFWETAIGAIAAVILFLAFALPDMGKKEEQARLIRPRFPWQTEVYELKVGYGSQREKISLPVHGMELSEDELEACFEEAKDLFFTQMLGENERKDYVTRDLDFSSTADGTELTASFRPRDFTALGADGRLIAEALSEEGVPVTIFLELRGGEWERTYETEVVLYPPEPSVEDGLLEAIVQAEQSERKEEEVSLPEAFEGQALSYETEEETKAWPALLLCLTAIPALFWQLPLERKKEALKKRDRQLLEDYPELVLRLSLLLKAGLAIRNAWGMMAREYHEAHSGGNKRRYAYEEMWLSLCRMESGVSEREEYQNFGIRIGLHPYLRLSGLLEQNLEKGNKSLLFFLGEEQQKAFEERKNQIRKLGEEAGTRLLGPMMLYFIIVLIILLVPAWMSFSL